MPDTVRIRASTAPSVPLAPRLSSAARLAVTPNVPIFYAVIGLAIPVLIITAFAFLVRLSPTFTTTWLSPFVFVTVAIFFS